ncbi:MAG TPA: uracil-DNA glycosylase family protein [Coleofasciculaceae cyanobacterium]|jgi:DNA polymerase
MSKEEDYNALVQSRKSCHLCLGLTNPAVCGNGDFDSDHMGPWTRWQGNLNAKLMIIGQDWGDLAYFLNNEGVESPKNPTNHNLMRLLASIGVNIDPLPKFSEFEGQVFLTNAILCLKQGGLQGAVRQEWFDSCGTKHLKPNIELVRPEVLISLGSMAYEVLQKLYDLPSVPFRDAVNSQSGIILSSGTQYFPMYHCGSRIINTHRKFAQQIEDWARVKSCFTATET